MEVRKCVKLVSFVMAKYEKLFSNEWPLTANESFAASAVLVCRRKGKWKSCVVAIFTLFLSAKQVAYVGFCVYIILSGLCTNVYATIWLNHP